jgi:predicted Zn-dependent peptidase
MTIKSSNQNGLQVHLCNTEKFKTINIMLTMKIPLKMEFTTARALIPQILVNGSKNYPNRRLIKQRLDEMFGATLFTDVQKKGDNHYISFRMEVPGDQYLNISNSLLEKSLHFLHEIVYKPALENGAFYNSIVEKEKRFLAQRIYSMYNDKIIYANDRLIEEMFKNDPYGLSALGRIEEIPSLNAAFIYSVYKELLQNASLDLFIVGAFNVKEVQQMIVKIFSEEYNNKPTKKIHLDVKNVSDVRVIQEKLDVEQGQLLLGYRTFTTIQDDDYEAILVANALFGRFPSSKLFVNLREKKSLAYFILSRIEINKGLLITMAGIDFKNYDYAVQVIREQEYAIKEGHFTDAEVEHAKAMLINLLLESLDNPLGIMDITIQSIDRGSSNNITDQIKRISMITKSDVIRVANKWVLDTIYFLDKKESE